MHRAFESMDLDRDGVISETDLVTSLGQCDVDEFTARRALLAADIHARGCLEFREFAAACLPLDEVPSDKVHGALEKLFKQLCGPSGGIDFSALLSRMACSDESDVDNLAALFRRHDRHGDGHLIKEDFFAALGVDTSTTWVPKPKPEEAKPLVRLLRGAAKDASIWGGCLQSWVYATVGQPSMAKKAGRWYYEVALAKCEYPQLGWVDQDFEFFDKSCDDGVGDDEHGWAVDGVRQTRWHNGENPYDKKWPRPVVIGCALNLESKATMHFSVDGLWSEAPDFQDIAFTGSLFPAASGIDVGTFRFSKQECRYSPPDSSYSFLDESDPQSGLAASPEAAGEEGSAALSGRVASP